MNIFRRVWDSMGLGENYDDSEFDYEYAEGDFVQDGQGADMLPPQDRAAPPSNVIGLPNRTPGKTEMVLMQPKTFAEIPQAVNLLRERKSVILNLSSMDPDQAQRSVDFVAGGVFAIDGHQERLGENIFLFTPHVVQITAFAAGTHAPAMAPPPVSPSILSPESLYSQFQR